MKDRNYLLTFVPFFYVQIDKEFEKASPPLSKEVWEKNLKIFWINVFLSWVLVLFLIFLFYDYAF